jgi:ribose 5-phosphate isomerase
MVEQRNILTKTKVPLAVADLRKMVAVVGLGCGSTSAVYVVPHGEP